MAAQGITPELANALQSASEQLIAAVRTALDDFQASPPAGWQSWETWRTPRPWKDKALPNLERYHADLHGALRAHQAGDIKPITTAAAGYAGLAKDLDFDTRWMTEENRLAVDQAVDRLVEVAGDIHRLGYEALAKAGRL